MELLLIALGCLALGAFAGAIAILVWLRHTLLSGITVIDANQIDPALRKEIERLELEYQVAEELGYGGDILLGLESQLNAARAKAATVAGQPDTSSTFVVTSPVVSRFLTPTLVTSDRASARRVGAGLWIVSMTNRKLAPQS